MKPYPFQARVCELLSSGRSVILQAPTGAGKTRAALYPFLRAWEYQEDFPRKCIYSVPLRVLADQFWAEYNERAENFNFRRPMAVALQTGAQPDDPKLEANLIFTTIDQTLSNVLNIPYARSLAQGNLNAGAVLSSYLVFDELHLFDPDTMLPTTLHLLDLVKGIVPFLVMTATLSEARVNALAERFAAEPLVLSPEEAAAIPSQHKTRRLHAATSPLDARSVLDRHHRRSIAICNTVNRAQALFEDLRGAVGPGTEVRLLHSRFLPDDRAAKEAWLHTEFGKDKACYTVESAILVATQVIEVGVDITSEALHTDLAPAASVLQRAGRCARYQDEVGDVYVYPLPLNRHERPNYAPYTGSLSSAICEKTWDEITARSGTVCDFGTEMAIVNAAHGEADAHIQDQLRAQRHAIADRIAQTIGEQSRSAATELIRHVDSRTVIAHPDPASITHPWVYEGFGLYSGSLFGAYKGLEELKSELGAAWALMTAEPEPQAESSREPVRWRWREITSREALAGALLVVVNPQLAHYSPETGFRLGVPGDARWTSPFRQRHQARGGFAPYQRETFQEHVTRMLHKYEHPTYDPIERRPCLALAEELAYAATRLEAKFGWPAGSLDQLARLIIALHDVGKLDRRWQTWAHRWQAEVGALRGEDLRIPEAYMAAHTDYDGQNAAEQALSRQRRAARPNHAVESAAAAQEVLWWHFEDQAALVRAAQTAIARHHTAGASGTHGDFQAHPAALAALAEVLAPEALAQVQTSVPAGTLARRLIRPRRGEELLPYLLLVRALRLADQRSQETRP